MYVFGQYTLLFVVYSFLGGLAETAFRLATEHHLYGIHGFLHLPILPIYGFGALLVLLMVRLLKLRNPILVFAYSIILTSALEFLTGWIIELIFHVRIWDYSDKPYTIDGRVSIENSIGFGAIALVLVYVIHPILTDIMKRIHPRILLSISFILLAVVAADFIVSFVQRLAAS
jgi:uncharacterized membrane protein